MEPNFQAPINASKNNQIWATCDTYLLHPTSRL